MEKKELLHSVEVIVNDDVYKTLVEISLKHKISVLDLCNRILKQSSQILEREDKKAEIKAEE